MMTQLDFAALRDRAYTLADTGRFNDWEQLCAELAREGANAELVRALNADGIFKLMIRNRIKRNAGMRR